MPKFRPTPTVLLVGFTFLITLGLAVSLQGVLGINIGGDLNLTPPGTFGIAGVRLPFGAKDVVTKEWIDSALGVAKDFLNLVSVTGDAGVRFQTSPAGGSVTFDYTGTADILWGVPGGVTSVTVDAYGASGAESVGYVDLFDTAEDHGKGGRIQTTLSVIPGETLYITVGGAASGKTGGFNGGGSGTTNAGAYGGTQTSGGGGGGSHIRRGSTPILVAGGGGGSGILYNGKNGGAGGGGGGLVGISGVNGASCGGTPPSGDCGKGGGGGTQSSGGTGGAGGAGGSFSKNGSPGGGGGFGGGGNGGSATTGYNHGGPGGGGGGGYYGGGGGGGGGAAETNGVSGGGGGGGGGSSFCTGCSGTIHAQGFQSGHGSITISWAPYANDWIIGSDRSDGGKFKISESATLGTNDRLKIDSTGVKVLSGNSGGSVGSLDHAELFLSSENVEKGDLVEINPNINRMVRKSSGPYSKTVIGVVSTNPASIIEGDQMVFVSGEYQHNPRKPAVALAGHVPLKVSNENGPIEVGDLLTSSSTPGYAMKFGLLRPETAGDFSALKSVLQENEQRRNSIIGKALEPFNGEKGEILVFIALQ